MALKKFAFNVLKKDKFARCGLIETHRGNIHTPTFMPVGTQATVKAVFLKDLRTFSGVIGCELTSASRDLSASLIAFIIAAGAPPVPASPAPLMTNGVLVHNTSLKPREIFGGTLSALGIA